MVRVKRALKGEKGVTGNHEKAVLGEKSGVQLLTPLHTVPEEQDSKE